MPRLLNPNGGNPQDQGDGQRVNGAGGQQSYEPQRGVRNPRFMGLLNQVSQQNARNRQEGFAGYRAPWAQGQNAGQSGSRFLQAQQETRDERGRENADEQQGRRKMTDRERILARAAQATDNTFGDVSTEKLMENPVGTVAKFVGSTLLSPATSIGSAVTNFAAAKTGDNYFTADLENNEIDKKKMDSNQRAAAVATGAIDAAGLAFGGSSDFLKAGGKAVGSAMGFGKKAATKVLDADSPWGRTAVQTAKRYLSSMAEEGGEEFVQSYTSDIRDNNLDDTSLQRAGESALWGAAGGALFSGGADIINATRTFGDRDAIRANKQAAAIQQNQPDQNSGDPIGRSWFGQDAVKTIGNADSYASETLGKKLAELNKTHGSTTYTGIDGSMEYGYNDVGLGVQGLKALYDRSDEDAQKIVDSANWYTDKKIKAAEQAGDTATADRERKSLVTREEMDELFYGPDAEGGVSWEQMADRLNDMIDSGKANFEVMALRNPFTKDNAQIKFKVKNFNAGNGIKMNQALASQFGGDFDGDTWGVHFDPGRVGTAKYATQSFLSQFQQQDENGQPVLHGRPNTEGEFMGLPYPSKIGSDEAFKSASRKAADVFGSNMQAMTGGQMDAATWSERYYDAATGGNFDVMVPTVLNKAYRQMSALPGIKADQMMSQAIWNMQSITYADSQLINAVSRQIVGEDGEPLSPDEIEAIGADIKTVNPVEISDRMPRGIRSGSVSNGAVRAIQLFRALGVATNSLAFSDNSALRTAQRIMWTTKVAEVISSGEWADVKTGDAVTNFITASFTIMRQDANPESAVVGIFNDMVLGSTLINCGITDISKIKTAHQWANFKETFVETYNDLVRPFNEAAKTLYIGYTGDAKDSIHKEPLDLKKTSQLWRAMDQVFGTSLVDKVIDGVKFDQPYTFHDLAEMVYEYGSANLTALREVVPEIATDIAEYAKYLKTKNHMQSRKLEDTIDQIKVDVPFETFDDGHIEFDPIYKPQMEVFLNIVRNVIGEDAALRSGFINVESFAASPWAKYLLAEDLDTRNSAFVGLAMSDKYRFYIDASIKAESMNEFEAKTTRDEALGRSVAKLYGISATDRMISSMLLNDDLELADRERLLRAMIDPNVTYASKADLLKGWITRRDLGGEYYDSLLSDALRTEDSEMGDGLLAAKVKNASNIWNQYQRVSMRNIESQINQLKDMANNSKVIDARTITGAINNLVREAGIDVDMRSLGAAAYAQTTVLKVTADKGKSQRDAAGLYASIVEAAEGTLASFTDRLTGRANGTMSVKQIRNDKRSILSIILDRDAAIQVEDDASGRYSIFTMRDFWGKVVGIADVDRIVNDGPSLQDWFKAFDKVPALVTWIAPSKAEQSSIDSTGSTKIVASTTLVDAVDRYIDKRTGQFNEKEYNASTERAHIRKLMFNQPSMVSEILMRMAGNNPGTDFNSVLADPDRFYKEFSRATNEAIDWYRTAMANGYGSAEHDIRASYRGMNAQVANQIQVLRERAFNAVQRQIDGAYNSYADMNDISHETISAMMNSEFLEWVQHNITPKIEKTDTSEIGSNIFTRAYNMQQLHEGSIKVQAFQIIFASQSFPTFGDLGLDRSVLGDVCQQIQDSDLDEATKADYKKRVEDKFNELFDQNLASEIADAVKELVDVVITPNEIDNQDFSSIARKMKKASGGDYPYLEPSQIPTEDQLRKWVEDDKGVDPSEQTNNFRNACARYNGAILSFLYNNMTASTGTKNDLSATAMATRVAGAQLAFLNTLEEDMSEKGSKISYTPATDGELRAPDMDFSNPDICMLIDGLQSTLEGAGNSMNAGIEGGQFKTYGAMALLDGSVENDGVPGQQMTLGEFRRVYGDQQELDGAFINPMQWARLRYTNPKSGREVLTQSVDDEFMRMIRDMPDDMPVQVYPLDDSPHGIGQHTLSGRNIDRSTFVYLNQLLAQLGFYGSEKGVFKRKKVIGKFTEIYRALETDGTIASWKLPTMLPGEDPLQYRGRALAQLKAYRLQLAERYYQEFIGEKMDGDFSKYDAYVLAQFTTPFIEVTDTVTGGTISQDVGFLFSDAAFSEFASNAQSAGIGLAQVSMRPVALPIAAITSKFRRDAVSTWRDLMETDPDKANNRSELLALTMQKFTDWGDFSRDDSLINEVYGSLMPIGPSSGAALSIDGQPTALANFINNLKDQTKDAGDPASKNAAIATIPNPQTRERIKEINGTYIPDQNNVPFIITSLYDDPDFDPNGLSEGMRKFYSDIRPLREVPSSTSYPGSNRSALVFMENNSIGSADKVRSAFDQASRDGAILLLRMDDDAIENIIGTQAYDQTRMGKYKVAGENMIALDPRRSNSEIITPNAYTAIREMSFDRYLTTYLDTASADSSVEITPEYADLSMLYQEAPFEISSKTLFGRDVTLGEITDDSLKDDFNSFVTEFKKSFKQIDEGGKKTWKFTGEGDFILPPGRDGKPIDNIAGVVANINTYISRVRSEGLDSTNRGFLTTDVPVCGVAGMAKTYVDNRWVYAPAIIQTGATSVVMDTLDIDTGNMDGRNLRFTFSARIKPSQWDGIKTTFPQVAYKGYETVMSDKRRSKLPKLKHFFDIPVGDPANGEYRKDDIDRVTSFNTESKRRFDNGQSLLADNLKYSSDLIPHGLWFKVDENGRWARDESMVNGYLGGYSKSVFIDRLNTPIWNDTHELVAEGRAVIGQTMEEQALWQKVFRRFRVQRMSPAVLLSNLEIDRVNGAEAIRQRKPLVWAHAEFFGGNYFSQNELLMIFNRMMRGMNFCPPDTKPQDRLYMFDSAGYRLGENNKYYPVHVHLNLLKNDSTMLGRPSENAAFSDQQIINKGLIRGLSRCDVRRYMEVMSAATGIIDSDEQPYTQFLRGGEHDRMDRADPNDMIFIDPKAYDKFDPTKGVAENIYFQKVKDEGYAFENNRLNVVSDDGSPLGDDQRREFDVYINTVWKNLGFPSADRKPSRMMLDLIVKRVSGYGYNDGDGSQNILVSQYKTYVQWFIRNLNSGVYPIQGGMHNKRLSIPVGSRSFQDWLWSIPLVQDKFNRVDGDRAKFDQLAGAELAKSKKALAYVTGQRKYAALKRNLYYAEISAGKAFPNGYLYAGTDAADVLREERKIYEFLSAADKEAYNSIDGMMDISRDLIDRLDRRRNSLRVQTMPVVDGSGNIVRRFIGSDVSSPMAVGRMAKNLAVANALLTPMLAPSAAMARMKASGLMNFEMYMKYRNSDHMLFQKRRIGAGGQVMDVQKLVRSAASSSDVRLVWKALNTLQFKTGDLVAMKGMHGDDLVGFVKGLAGNQGVLQKITDTIFNFSSANGAMTSWQITCFLNDLAARITPDKAAYWYQPVPFGEPDQNVAVPRFVAQLLADPASFIVDALAMDERNTLLLPASQARTHALEADLAQQTAASLFINALFQQHPTVEVLTKLGGLRFPQYVFKVSGWYMQHIAPMSALNYLVTKGALAKAASENPMFLGVDLSTLGLERTQVYGSLKEALTHDAVSIGMAALAGLLISMMCLEPPEDEDKMGNLNEWTFFGLPLQEAWWINDIIGPAIAIAATEKSFMIGKPRLDILPNWMGQVMYNNPMLRIGGMVTDLLEAGTDPEQDMLGFTEESEAFGDAKFGSPNGWEVLTSRAATFGMSFLSQFLTPSFVRDAYNTLGDKMEHSYKKVYATDDTGRPLDNGQTVNTSYFDAQMRKLSRSNPFAALLLNTANGLMGNDNGTGYFSWQMPLTKYYEDIQINSINAYSLYTEDENGNIVPKSAEDRKAIAYEIIGTLMATDDLDQLAAQGWMIDYSTREYVSKTLWDQYHYLQELHNEWIQNGGKNYDNYADWDTGMAIVSQQESAFYDDLQNIKTLYQKLWDPTLTTGLQAYNRYKTTYQQDANGEWYASGFANSPFSIMPFDTQRGENMGKENDWATRSIVTGESTGQRALVAAGTSAVDVPAIETWAADEAGESYSDMAADTVGDLAGQELDAGSNNWNNMSNGGANGYGKRYYSRSYGYRRSGGGGGGSSYSPKIYSNLPNVSNISSPRVMSYSRSYTTNYDYLRPSFETKGSRESYKREDI